MKDKRFQEIVTNRLNACKEVLTIKNKEYSSDTDRLHNFKRAASILGSTQEQALLGMWTKHIVSILDLLENPSSATPSLLAEKFGDNINYSLLAEAVLTERMEVAQINPVLKPPEPNKYIQTSRVMR